MKEKTRQHLFIILCLLYAFVNGYSQKTFTKALGYPEKFSPAIDVVETDMIMYLSKSSEYSKSNPWIVFNDRAGNQTYDKPDGKPLKKLDFKEVLYVVSEAPGGGWIEVVRGTTDGLKLVKDQKYMGWVRKDKLLLWNEGLIDQNTRIHKKALLLNKASEIAEVLSQSNKDIVNVYDSPTSTTSISHANIYRYFFIFKKENNRYLLAQEYKLSPSNVEIRLLGWVSSARCEVWNTRISLEPNSDEPAFNERAVNLAKYKFVAYESAKSAEAQMRSGFITTNDELWSNDPCVADKSFLAKGNPRRFIGDIIRFPLLPSKGQDPSIFFSGVIGDIYVTAEGSSAPLILDEKAYLAAKEAARKESINRKQINILYVVEGSSAMAQYKDQVKGIFDETMQKLDGYENVKIGMVVYRDVSERMDKRDIEILPLTTNGNKFQEFISGINFINMHDEDELSNMRDGIHRGLLESGFGKDQSNIIIVLGYSPDFSANTTRKNGAIASMDPAYHTREDLVESLSAVNASIYFVQCKNNGDVYSERFKSQAEDIILELAKNDYNNYLATGTEIGVKDSPSLNDSAVSGIMRLNNSVGGGFAYFSSTSTSLSLDEIKSYSLRAVDTSNYYIKGHLTNIKNVIEQGQPFATSGPFSAAMAKWLDKEIKRQGSVLNKDLLKSLMGTKYELYKEVYFPYKIQNANFPLVTYVLFMPQSDLQRYIEKLRKVEEASYASSDNERRTKLFNVFKELIQAFTGNYTTSSEEISKMSINEFQSLMNGVKGEGLRLSKEQNYLLGNILDESKMSSAKVSEVIKRILEKLDKLEKIIRLGRNYEFSFSTDEDIYYWITLDESF
jgi:hypothetical protein